MWESQNPRDKQWVPYGPEEARQLEACYQSGSQSVQLEIFGNSFTVDVRALNQKNTRNQSRPIRRSAAAPAVPSTPSSTDSAMIAFTMYRSNPRDKWGMVLNEHCRVNSIEPNSPAYSAGIPIGCRVSKVNGQPVGHARDFIASMQRLPPDARQSVSLEACDIPADVTGSVKETIVLQRGTASALTPTPAHGWGVETDLDGISVSKVHPDSPADWAAVVPGCRLVTIDGNCATCSEAIDVLTKDTKPEATQIEITLEVPLSLLNVQNLKKKEAAQRAQLLQMLKEKQPESISTLTPTEVQRLTRESQQAAEERAKLEQQLAEAQQQMLALQKKPATPAYGVVPSYWERSAQFPRPGFKKIAIGGAELSRLQQLVSKTTDTGRLGVGRDLKFNMSYSGLTPSKVYRIQNDRLWVAYATHRDLLTKNSTRFKPTTHEDESLIAPAALKPEYNELYLWHGTLPSLVELICQEGFDERAASLGGLYGAGSYFAEHISKADQYCTPHPDNDKNGTFYCFLSRVAMGKIHETSSGRSNERRAPNGCDSLVGQLDSTRYKEFVVYDGWQAYPEFLVEYKRT